MPTSTATFNPKPLAQWTAAESEKADDAMTSKSLKSPKYPAVQQPEGNSCDFDDFDSNAFTENDPFPVDCLPGIAGRIARESAAAALVPETLTAMNVLGIISAAIGAGLEVASGGDRTTRANLFLLPAAQSGTGKGQSFSAIAAPFLDREREHLEQWRRIDRPQASAQYSLASARAEGIKKEFKGKQMDQQKRAALIMELQEVQREIDAATRALREPAWSTEQATKEAVESLMENGTLESLASLSAEARGAVDILMGRYREATDESVFLAGYSGDPVKIHRKNSPTICLLRPCLTLLWAMQPDKLHDLLGNEAMTESGLLPRFLLADTKAEPQEEPEQRPRLTSDLKIGWAKLIGDLLDEYHERHKAASIVQPEPQAEALLRDYFNEVARLRRTGGELADIAIYAARWGENAWRLALVLHAAAHGADADQEILSVATASAAIRLMRWFSKQQLLVLAAGRGDQRQKCLDRLRDILIRKPNQQANLSELKHSHGVEPAEVERLAAFFPSILEILQITTSKAGRPPRVARLKDTMSI